MYWQEATGQKSNSMSAGAASEDEKKEKCKALLLAIKPIDPILVAEYSDLAEYAMIINQVRSFATEDPSTYKMQLPDLLETAKENYTLLRMHIGLKKLESVETHRVAIERLALNLVMCISMIEEVMSVLGMTDDMDREKYVTANTFDRYMKSKNIDHGLQYQNTGFFDLDDPNGKWMPNPRTISSLCRMQATKEFYGLEVDKSERCRRKLLEIWPYNIVLLGEPPFTIGMSLIFDDLQKFQSKPPSFYMLQLPLYLNLLRLSYNYFKRKTDSRNFENIGGFLAQIEQLFFKCIITVQEIMDELGMNDMVSLSDCEKYVSLLK